MTYFMINLKTISVNS